MEKKFPPRHENQNVVDQMNLTAGLYHYDENGTFRLNRPKKRGKKARKAEKREMRRLRTQKSGTQLSD